MIPAEYNLSEIQSFHLYLHKFLGKKFILFTTYI